MRTARPADTREIYALLQEVRFRDLPEFVFARPVIERSCALVARRDGKVAMWACFHKRDGDLHLDVVVAPEFRRRLFTKGMVKEGLAYGFSLTQSERMVVDCYNSEGVKAALAVGFTLAPDEGEDGRVRMMLTRAEFERKFVMRGRPL